MRSFIARVDATPMSNLVKTEIILKEKLPSIEDRGQADRVTMNATVALPCLNLTHDLDFYPRRAMVITRRPTHVTCSDQGQLVQKYDTICYFNVPSKADMSQLNLPHETNN